MDTQKTIIPIQRQTLQQKVYEKLKMLILEGVITPGTKLNETSVAKQMNTSTTPVREAFRMLAAEGFVRMEPWKGVVVEDYDRSEIEDVYRCRKALELLGMELTIENLKKMDESAKVMSQIDEEINRSELGNNLTEIVSVNCQIHDLWIKGSKNKRLEALMESLNDVLLHDRNVAAMDGARREEIIAEHIEILKAVRLLDTEKAKEALSLHIDNEYKYSLNALKEKENNTSEQ